MKAQATQPNAKYDFSKGSVPAHVLRIALPMTAAQLINLLYSVVDRIYLGRLPEAGTLALAGVGLVFPIIALMNAFARLSYYGAVPLFSIARGEGDDERAGRILGNAYTLLLITAGACTLLIYLFKTPVLRAIGASDDTFAYADDYLTIYLAGTAFSMCGTGMNGFINAQGFSVTGMLTVLIGAVVNIALDPLFIFVFGMGVRGAAIATVIGQFCSAAWVLLFLAGKKPVVRLRLRGMALDARIVARSLALGVVGFVMEVTNSAVSVVYNTQLQALGGDMYVGIMTVVHSVQEIVQLPGGCLTQGAAPVMSYNFGAGRLDRVKAAFRFMTLGSLGMFAAMWVLLMTAPAFFIRVFNSDPAMVEHGVRAIRAYFAVFMLMAFQGCGQNGFVSLGLTRYAIFFSVLRKGVLVIPFAFLYAALSRGDPVAVLYAEPTSHVLGSVSCFVSFMLIVWRNLDRFYQRRQTAL